MQVLWKDRFFFFKKLNPFIVQIMIGPGLKFNVNTTFIEKDQVKFK